MVDVSANSFLHWVQGDITQTELPEFIKYLETDKDGNTGNVIAAGKITLWNSYIMTVE
ncbi:MAG: hypothetical protein K6E60_02965 [Saccharofermentans sp.]|nr:hypothetical protein [Saccharofermentans sp.]